MYASDSEEINILYEGKYVRKGDKFHMLCETEKYSKRFPAIYNWTAKEDNVKRNTQNNACLTIDCDLVKNKQNIEIAPVPNLHD